VYVCVCVCVCVRGCKPLYNVNPTLWGQNVPTKNSNILNPCPCGGHFFGPREENS